MKLSPVSNLDSDLSTENWALLFAKLEKHVVAGEHQECRALLRLQNPHSGPRDWAPQFAELAIRVHFPLYALKKLHAYIHPENKFAEPARDREIMLYAAALYNLGAVQESIETLKRIKNSEDPEIYFYRASAHFFEWNYEPGIPHLKKFVEAESLTPYRRLVGQVNLAAALVSVRDWIASDLLLNEIIQVCVKNSHQLLLGNCYELKAQVQFYQGNYNAALRLLEKSWEQLKEQNGLYSLFVKKWQTICLLMKKCDSQSLQQLQVLREEARSHEQWGTLRECDLFESIATKNFYLFEKVIMGTHHEFYRKRARLLFGESLNLKGQYVWSLGGSSGKPVYFDPLEKQKSGRGLFENPGLFKTFLALSRDFYEPSSLGQLFQFICADEHFNPYTSPKRILQLLSRLDDWFQEEKIPLRVHFKKSSFSLISQAPVQILLRRGQEVQENHGPLIALKKHFGTRSMTVQKIAEVLKISPASTRRLLQTYIEEGKVEKKGAGKNSIYMFRKPSRKALRGSEAA